jgi:hypothetical protein
MYCTHLFPSSPHPLLFSVGAVIDGQRARRRVQVSFVCGPTEQIREIVEREVD